MVLINYGEIFLYISLLLKANFFLGTFQWGTPRTLWTGEAVEKWTEKRGDGISSTQEVETIAAVAGCPGGDGG